MTDQPPITINPEYTYVPLVDPDRAAGEALPAKIRIFTLFPSNQLENDLHISLQIVEIASNSCPEYEAISYAWGDNDKTGHVTIDGQYRLGITASLDSALRHLRLGTRARSLWADAICIDQEADKERSHQVQLMGDVYRGASQVVVWLGSEADNSTLALNFFRRLASSFTIDWETDDGNPLFRRVDEAQTPVNLREIRTYKDCGASAAQELAVFAVFRRPWWERVWVRQEIFLARQAIVQCGPRVIPWDIFRNAVEFIWFAGPYPSASAFVTPLSAHQLLHRVHLVWTICRPRVESVLGLLHSARMSECRDPRDKIYGMLSLIESSEHWVAGSIVPDYGGSTTAIDVYTDFAWRHILTTHSLVILTEAGLPQAATRLETLRPSWVPDWTSLKKNLRSFHGQAGTWMEPKVSLMGKGTLRVSGVILPRVARVFSCPSEPSTESVLLVAARFLRQTFRSLRGQPPELDSPGVHEMLQVYCRVLHFNTFQDNSARGMWIEDRYRFDDALQLLSVIVETSEDDLKQIISGNDAEINAFFRMSTIQDASLAVTEDGRLGRVPNSTEAGDVFGVVPSHTGVLVLRPVEAGKDDQHKPDIARYAVVGSSFLDGYMHGEALLGQLPRNMSVTWTKYVIPTYLDICSGTSTLHDPRLESFDVFEKMDESKREKLTYRQRCGYVTMDMLRERGVPIQEIDLV